MSWFKVDDKFHSHPKVCGVSLAAIGLWSKAGSWCGDHLTNGAVPRGAVVALGGTPELAAELVDAGLWRETPKGWQFHEWLDHQPPAEDIKAKREAAKERMRRVRSQRVRANIERTESEQPAKFARSSPSPDPDPDPVKISSEEITHPRTTASVSNARAHASVLKLGMEFMQAIDPSAFWDVGTWREQLETIGEMPEAQRAIALRTIQGSEWCRVNTPSPKHVLAYWTRYSRGQEASNQIVHKRAAGMSPMPTAADYERDRTEPAPWEM